MAQKTAELRSDSDTVRVILSDRFNRDYILSGKKGQTLSNFLIENQIPCDAVIAYEDDVPIDDQNYLLKSGPTIRVRMVRAYQLPEFGRMLGLWQGHSKIDESHEDSIYTKKILWFDGSGVCKLKTQSFNQEQFIQWMEETFVTAILDKELIKENDEIVLALSGGRDSIALLYLLYHCKDKLPPHTLYACTVQSLAHDADMEVAKEVADLAQVVEWDILNDQDLENIFKLKVPYREAVRKVFDELGRPYTMYVTHHLMRTGVESYMRRKKLNKLCMGLHAEDIMAGVLRGSLLGWQFGESAWEKTWGPYSQIFPLWPITKKELTLYLEYIAPPKHSAQGPPIFIDTGDHNRDLHYFLADHLQTLWPGFPLHLFHGIAQRYKRDNIKIHHQECPVCLGYFIPERATDPSLELCQICRIFRDLKLSEVAE